MNASFGAGANRQLRRYTRTAALVTLLCLSAAAHGQNLGDTCFTAIHSQSRYAALYQKIAVDPMNAPFAQLGDSAVAEDEEKPLIESLAIDMKSCTQAVLNAGPGGADRAVYITAASNRDRLFVALYNRQISYGQFNSLRADNVRAAREQYAQNQSQSMQQVNNTIIQMLTQRPQQSANPPPAPYLLPTKPAAATFQDTCQWIGQFWTCNGTSSR